MNETKLKWSEPEVIDLSVKETKMGPYHSETMDGPAWHDSHGNYQEPHGQS